MAPRTATPRRLLAALGLTVTAPLIVSACAAAPPVVTPSAPAPPAEALPSSEAGPPPASLAPLPLARDGSDLKACQSGRCQVLINGPTTMTVGGLALTAAVDSGGVTVTGSDADDNHVQVATSSGSTNTLSMSGHTVTVRVLGIQGVRAVLDFS
jgi:hypothetical protein